MKTDSNQQGLQGKLLIAMPGMNDPRFLRSVIYICAHGDEGAMGLIINKPVKELGFDELLSQLGIRTPDSQKSIKVHFGGPVEVGRGFVLHSEDYSSKNDTQHINQSFGMTATREIIEDISEGHGPKKALLVLGYSGWGPGQLEHELKANGWLVCDATDEIVFDSKLESKWSAAIKTLGIDPTFLSAKGGTA